MAGAHAGGAGSGRLRRLFDLGRAPERQLLRGAVPVALLFAVPRHQLRARECAAVRLVVQLVAGHPDPVDPRRLPADLLLLPQGLLPLLLLVAAGLRGAGRRPAAIPARPASRSSCRTSTATSSGRRCRSWRSCGGDAIIAFNFGGSFGIGLGTLVLIANAALLSLYSFSCHSCRHLCGGGLNSFKLAPDGYKLWGWVTKLNEKHMQIAWTSLVWVGPYRRLRAAAGPRRDPGSEVHLMAGES